jgi:5'-3' exonuclease
MNQPLELMNTEETEKKINPTFIFVDGSYYCFYRYYSLIKWWKNAHKDEPLDQPIENQIFVDKFKKIFVEHLKEMQKKLHIDKKIKPILIVGKDCKRENIWRNKLFSKYKANRVYNEDFSGKPFFQMAYEDELFQKGDVKAILEHPELEADDCIAISVKHLLAKYPDCQIYIITSDRDYLQLNADNVHLYNLSYVNIADTKSSTGNAKNDLEIKIIMGDVSDNIPSVFPKCGPKTAMKCVEDAEFFAKKMANNPEYYQQYELNKKLVNFDCIPLELVEDFLTKNKIK